MNHQQKQGSSNPQNTQANPAQKPQQNQGVQQGRQDRGQQGQQQQGQKPQQNQGQPGGKQGQPGIGQGQASGKPTSDGAQWKPSQQAFGDRNTNASLPDYGDKEGQVPTLGDEPVRGQSGARLEKKQTMNGE